MKRYKTSFELAVSVAMQIKEFTGNYPRWYRELLEG
jgi:hypothetical protein